MAQPVLKCQHLGIQFGGLKAVDDFNMEIGESELVGSGISFCAVCDGAFFENKEVLVIGGGNSALQEAVLLAKTCKKVTVVQNLAVLTGERSLQESLFQNDRVEFVYSATVSSFRREGERISTALSINGQPAELFSDGVFVAIGLAPDNQPFEQLVSLQNGYIQAGEDCLTQTPGVFAAGDCRTKGIRQITTATGDGAVAALAACRYLDARS